jgi:DNA polymerase III alpha subunit
MSYLYQNHHRHDYYTNVIVPDSPVSPEDYAKRAVELGHSILSSVQHGWTGRYIEHYELAKKYNLKFLFGVEAYIVKDRLEKDNTNAHIILLAKNENGRRGINRILSEANLTGYYYRPRIDMPLLFSLPPTDVWVTSGCLGGLWKYEDADDLILKVADYFKGNFFLEVQNHNTESQKALNTHILDLANKNNLNLIFGCDSHYIYPQQSKERDDYLLSKHMVYEDEEGWYLDYPDNETAEQRFIKQGILTQAQIKEAMENTNVLLDVEDYPAKVFQKTLKLPSVYPDKTQEEKDAILSSIIWSEWETEKDNVPQDQWEHYVAEINKEMDVIITTKIADYFLLDYQVVKRGKELNGSITMTGRGSAPSFYTSKLLGFTTIDRIAATVKLFPERFITKERILEAGTLPDIDYNLGTPEIFAKAQIDVLGDNHSYPMLAYGTLHPKAAWKMLARAKNIDFLTANQVSEQINDYEMALKHTEEDEKENVDILEYIDDHYKTLYQESTKYLGIVSDYKIHPCAYLLYDGDIKEEIGLIKIKENLCCVMDGLWAENYKFLKNDLLKVSIVDLIYRVYDRIGRKPHPLPELLKICANNEKVWNVYKNAWTMGINQVEQTSTKGRVAKYAPKNISELSAFVGAIRPGFKSNYKQFESRQPFSYGIPSLDNIIQTKEFPQSYLIYQENVMQVLAYAGIPISETYTIIKNIAKKRVDKVLKYKEQFLDGMIERIKEGEGRTQEESEKIAQMTWQIIEDNSHYGFNSSHAYSVAGDSLYGAYLKSHYPLEFYEVFLNLLEESGDKDRLTEAKIEAEKAYKIKFPPYRFGQDNRKIVVVPEKHEITSSLSSIKGFSDGVGQNLYTLGQNKYDNFVDFLIDAEEQKMISKKFEDLIRIDYFECFGKNKKLYLFFKEFTSGKLRYSSKHTEKTKLKRIEKLKKFFEELPDERMPFASQLEAEKEILGYIQTILPVDKKFVYVLELNEKFAPRVQLYCLHNGKISSLKIQRRIFENKVFYPGDILYCKNFIKKPSIKFSDGKYEEIDGEYTWWLDDYKIIKEEDFNIILKGV